MLLYVLIAIIAYLAISQALNTGLTAQRVETVDYSQFVEMVKDGEVTQAESTTPRATCGSTCSSPTACPSCSSWA